MAFMRPAPNTSAGHSKRKTWKPCESSKSQRPAAAAVTPVWHLTSGLSLQGLEISTHFMKPCDLLSSCDERVTSARTNAVIPPGEPPVFFMLA